VSPLEYLACAVIGVIAGGINAIAAGGSFLTLPLLLFLGFPAAVANGTNRVGVLAQNLSAVWGYHRHKVLDWKWALAVSVPAMIGAALGVWGALIVPEVAFRRVLAIVMLAVSLGTLLHRSFGAPPPDQPHSPWHWQMVLGFFVAGIYGGFLQAGVGFLILAVTTLGGHDLVRGNAVKVFSVMAVTLLSLAVFSGTGKVDWPAGIALGIGNILGASLGVRVAVLRGHKWLERILAVAIIVFAVLLWVTE
jgi:uncharacterized protein